LNISIICKKLKTGIKNNLGWKVSIVSQDSLFTGLHELGMETKIDWEVSIGKSGIWHDIGTINWELMPDTDFPFSESVSMVNPRIIDTNFPKTFFLPCQVVSACKQMIEVNNY